MTLEIYDLQFTSYYCLVLPPVFRKAFIRMTAAIGSAVLQTSWRAEPWIRFNEIRISAFGFLLVFGFTQS